jgi:putative effector of murein hydrolase
MPATVLGVVTYFAASWRRLRAQPWLSLLIATAVLVGVLTLAAISYHQHGATMRYELDFAPPLLFASVLGGVAWLQRLDRTWLRTVAGGAAMLVVGWSVFFVLNVTAVNCVGTGSC